MAKRPRHVNLISVKQLAKRASYSSATISRMCQGGILEPLRVGNAYFFNERDVPALLRTIEAYRKQARLNQATKKAAATPKTESPKAPVATTETHDYALVLARVQHLTNIVVATSKTLSIFYERYAEHETLLKAFAASVGYVPPSQT